MPVISVESTKTAYEVNTKEAGAVEAGLVNPLTVNTRGPGALIYELVEGTTLLKVKSLVLVDQLKLIY